MDYVVVLNGIGILSAAIFGLLTILSSKHPNWLSVESRRLELVTKAKLLSLSIAVSVVLIRFRQATWNWSPELQFGVAAFAAFILAVYILRNPAIGAAVIPKGETAKTLAWIRVVVCSGLFILATRVDLTDIALLPKELVRFETMVTPLVDSVFSPEDLRNPTHLFYIQLVTILSLSAAVLGFGGRVSLVLSALSYTLFYHIQIGYTHFYHSGLIPLQILYALCLMPVFDAFALDRVIARRFFAKSETPETSRSALTYGWCVFVCWTIYGVAYCATGLSKLWVTPLWTTDGNVLGMSLSDSLHIIEYDFNLAAKMVNWGIADYVFPLLGVSAMVVEWAGIVILFSKGGRLLIPWMIAAMHLGIWFCHDFLFYELAVMPLMFIPAWRGICGLPRENRCPQVGSPRIVSIAGALTVSALISLITSGWLYSKDKFPLLSYWGMYAVHANRPLEWVHYSTVYKVRASGLRQRTEFIEYFSILNHARWLDHVGYTSDPGKLQRMKALFSKVFELEKNSSDPVVRIEIESSSWNIKLGSSDRNYGSPTHRMRFEIDGSVVEEKL